jgi:hypothetical protein
MMKEIYGLKDDFFKEIDMSIRKNCHKIQDVQPYMIQFQGFSQDLMMLMGNLMKAAVRKARRRQFSKLLILVIKSG